MIRHPAGSPGRGVLLVAAVTLLVAGCSTAGGTPGLREAADRGYVAGDGRLVVVAPQDRGQPVELSGQTLEGTSIDAADLRGRAVVINVWGSWCPPCRAEAGDLVDAHDDLTTRFPDRVSFVGINVRDASPTNARRFQVDFGVPYPSWYDPDSRLLLQLRGEVSPSSIPSTLVLDRSGAVAARVSGEVDAGTLVGVVEDVLAASPGASG